MNKTIVALDFSSEEEILKFLDQFDQPIYVKLGMESIYGCGFEIIKKIKARGHYIFLDLKLHDIPNTVKKAMKNLAQLGVDMVNVHASGGINMMKAALEGLKEGNPNNPPLCIAVTQLTSLSDEILKDELGINMSVQDAVKQYALNAKKAGLAGVVCSVHEVNIIHEVCGDDFICVTPGIRLASDSSDDQKRVATPTLAKEQGSNYIVVGRSITTKENPKEVYETIEKEMQ